MGRLAQGLENKGYIQELVQTYGTNTITFIQFNDIPKDRVGDLTYGRIVVDHRPTKADPFRSRLTVGGNNINYPGSVYTPTADLTTIKLLINSTISTSGAKIIKADIPNFYLNTIMDIPEFMFSPKKIIPPQIMEEYRLQEKEHKGKVYIKIQKGMYGLPQAGKLAHAQLVNNLAKDGYHPCKFTPGLWRHEWRPIQFVLVVDDFGIKYTGWQHAQHLLSTLNKYYSKVTVDKKIIIFP